MKKILCIFISVIFLLSSCSFSIEAPHITDNAETQDNDDFIVTENNEKLKLPIYEYDTLNPLFTKSSSVSETMRLVYEPLFEINADYTAVPVLAESYSVSDGGKRVRVTLKEGIKFHDGTLFNAADVKYSFDTIKNYHGKYIEYVKDVRSCEREGNYTVVFNLTRPVANFASLLTFPIIANNSSLTADDTFIPNGTGPYGYIGKGDTHSLQLRVFDQWHKTLPAIKEVSLLIITDKQTATYAFGANEVDCITGQAVNLAKYNPKGQNNMYSYTSNALTLIGMNFYNSIFWGKNTRQAFSYLVDKESVMKNIIYRRGKETDVPINPDSWYYGGHTEVYNYDTSKAEQLLLLDGWTKLETGGYSRNFNGTEQQLKLNILVNGENEEKVDIANAVAQNFIDMGIPTSVVAASFDEYYRLLNSKQFDMAVCEVVMPNNMDPYMLLSSSSNYFTYSNPDMDALLESIGIASDRETTLSYYGGICDLFVDDAPFIPMFFREGTLICNTKIVGDIRPGPENVFANIDEWYLYNQSRGLNNE